MANYLEIKLTRLYTCSSTGFGLDEYRGESGELDDKT